MNAPQVEDLHPTFKLAGELDFSSAKALTKRLHSAIGRSRATIDLSDISFMDAGVLGCFVRLHKAMREADGDSVIHFTGVALRFVRLFQLTKLDSIFRVNSDS